MARLGWAFAPWLSVLGACIAWEAFSASGAVTPFMLPRLSTVALRIWSDTLTGDLQVNLWLSLMRAFAGFAIAAVVGVPLGILIVRNAAVRWFFDPIVSVGFPMPKIAFLPIIALWFGFFDLSKISMVVFDTVFPVVTAAVAGASGVESQLLWSARALGASERQMLREIVLPAALPQIFTGLQVALPIALIVCIVAEMKMGGQGLGGAMITASRFADSPGVFAGIVEIAVVGWLLVRAMAWLRLRLLVWHQEALTHE